MPRMIYDYTKSILERVSFAPDLFVKELKKAVRNLLPNKIKKIKNWFFFFTMKKKNFQKFIFLE
jgi:hypothetical protein